MGVDWNMDVDWQLTDHTVQRFVRHSLLPIYPSWIRSSVGSQSLLLTEAYSAQHLTTNGNEVRNKRSRSVIFSIRESRGNPSFLHVDLSMFLLDTVAILADASAAAGYLL